MDEPHQEAANTASVALDEAHRGRLHRKIWDFRTNSRFAYILQISSRILTSGLALVWYRLLVGAMGEPLYGLYLAFQNVFSLGGLGDLGMGGAVGIKAGQYLGAGTGKRTELLRFLASARSVFLILTLACGGGLALVSTRLPQWLKFPYVPEAGSLTPIVLVGAVMVAGVMSFSYIGNLNYACGNITWPILPDFLLLQASLLCHWFLARQTQPLWVQFLPYLAAGLLRLCFVWLYVRASHPFLSNIFPLKVDRRLAINLFEGSFWVYLCCLGNMIYRSTDALVINAGFAPGTLVRYVCNYRFCELMVFVVASASFVILPKMTQWMASTDPKDQERVRVEMRRLNQFQILLGCGAALCYLAFNNIFMTIWWYHSAHPIAPAVLALQLAFALNMAVTASGDAGLQLSLRSGARGLRIGGMLVAATGLLNVALSVVAMKMKSLEGIALATVLAQSCVMLGSSYYLCGHLKMSWFPWAFKGCFLPLLVIGTAGWLRNLWPMDSIEHALCLLGSYAAMFVVMALGLGVNAAMIREEIKIVKSFVVK